jgi:hypothetical protein
VLLAGSEGTAWCEAAKKVTSALNEVELVSYTAGSRGDIDSKHGFETTAGISANGASLIHPDIFLAWRERRLPGDATERLEG